MFYPEEWDVTPITITNTTIGFDGIDDIGKTAINVRMVFKKKHTQDQYGNKVEGNGQFYKKGELDLAYGDNFTYNGIEYSVMGVYPARCEDGTIEFTRIDF